LEKETEIKAPARQLRGKCPAHCRKKETPPDNPGEYRDDQGMYPCQGSTPFPAMTS